MIARVWFPHGGASDMSASTADVAGVVRHIHGPSAKKASRLVARKVVMPRKDPGPNFVEALAHGIAVLECWQGTEVWLGNTELAARSGLTQSTVSRLVSVLENLGYLVRESKRGRFRLTGATLGLGYGSVLSAGALAKSELTGLAQGLDVYASLGIRLLDKVKIIENVASRISPDIIVNDVGALLPMCRSASGLAAMALLPEPEASRMLPRLKTHYGDRWPTFQRQLTSKRHEYASKGYCTSVLSLKVGAVAVPFVHPQSHDIYVVACAMPAQDFYPERVERDIAPKMFRVAHALTDTLSR